MKTSLLLKLLAALAVVGTASVSAQTLYWDPGNDGNLGGGGVTGNWGPPGVGANVWRPQTGAVTPSGSVPVTSGLGAPQTWVNNANAVFGNAGAPSGAGNEPGTVTLAGIGTYPLNAGSITFDAPGYVISTTSTGRTFSANQLAVNYAAQITLNASTPGVANFTATQITGAGTLTLNNTSTAADNLFLRTGTSTSTSFQVSGAATGVLTGLVATADMTLTGNVSSTVANVPSANRTLLAAESGRTLTIGVGSTVSSLGVATQLGTSTFSGTVALSGGSMTSPIDVVGGTFQVSSALASTNVTVQSGATLRLGASNVLADVPGPLSAGDLALTLNGGTMNVNGFTDTLGSLTLTASSVIDFGTGGFGSLTFKMVDLTTWNPGTTLAIWNWTQNQDHLFANNVAGWNAWPNAAGFFQTPRITFYSDNGQTVAPESWTTSAGWSPTGVNFAGTTGLPNEIVPVPEPTAVLSSLLLVFAIGWRERGLFARRRPVVA